MSPTTTLHTHNTMPLHSHNPALSPPSTPLHSHGATMSHTPNATPLTPLCGPNVMPKLTPVHPAIQISGSSTNDLTTIFSPSSISLTAGSSDGGHSSLPSPPSSQGSASRLASIMTAFDELALELPVPHYVVVRGISPGVYANWCESTSYISDIS
jgi:hypothetical protein